ncbi:MAG: T9SS type A sorting domain-containing protein [Flavobacteriales bacterium]|nr:T9SS type A sorting domain-containing protein [Flavobacteriales bacterium]
MNSTGYITFEAGDEPGLGQPDEYISIHTVNTYNDNAWHQAALLVDKTNLTIRIFIDGVQSELEGMICGDPVSGNEISIAGCNFNANEDNPNLTTLGDNMLGGLDEIMGFGTLISLDDIATFYANSFIVTPQLQSPLNSSSSIDPGNTDLMWQSISGISEYELEIDSDPAFSSTTSVPVFTNSLNITTLEPSTTYFWRVRSVSPSGNSNFSETWSFTTLGELEDAPILTLPVDNAQEVDPGSVMFTWNALSDASSYNLEYDSDVAFSAPTAVIANSNSQIVSGLDPNTTYHWRVNGENVLGISPYSAIWSFTTIAPLTLAPNLVSPANGATGLSTASVPLTWSALVGASDYTMEYSTSNAFISPITETMNGTTTNVEGLEASTTYYWRVKGNNAVGSSPYSDVWSFTTDDMTGTFDLEGSQITIFPNPVRSDNILNLHNVENDVNRVEIISSNGKIILSRKLRNKESDLTINTSKIASGNYIIRSLKENGKNRSQKIIIQD